MTSSSTTDIFQKKIRSLFNLTSGKVIYNIMATRKSLAEPSYAIHPDRDVMSSRMENYWVYGLNIRRILHPNNFMDELLSLVLDYCGTYVPENQTCFLLWQQIRDNHGPSILGIYSSLREAQTDAMDHLLDWAKDNGKKSGQEICQGLVMPDQEKWNRDTFQHLTSAEILVIMNRYARTSLGRQVWFSIEEHTIQ